MKVRAEFFSRLREIAGTSALEIDLSQSASVDDLFIALRGRFPEFARFEQSVLFGLGVAFVDRRHALREGDVIAIMPPVQGG
ncbi:MAG: MoaD/ThiS family protein [Verrucomicrobiota bacterium]|nr:MoaD/ThiS family protein [Verrucomicrobiota bacterium]